MRDIQREIKEALEKATPGPWDKIYGNVFQAGGTNAPICQLYDAEGVKFKNHEANTHLIANAPTWLLHQQQLIEQLQAEIKRLTNTDGG